MSSEDKLIEEVEHLIDDMLPYAIQRLLRIKKRKIAERIAKMAKEFVESKYK